MKKKITPWKTILKWYYYFQGFKVCQVGPLLTANQLNSIAFFLVVYSQKIWIINKFVFNLKTHLSTNEQNKQKSSISNWQNVTSAQRKYLRFNLIVNLTLEIQFFICTIALRISTILVSKNVSNKAKWK